MGLATKACCVKTYLQLLTMFGSLSLLSIGGGNAVVPEMHMEAAHWLTNSQFADIFAISQAAPGRASSSSRSSVMPLGCLPLGFWAQFSGESSPPSP